MLLKFALRFLNDGIESPELNQKLLEAFCYDFELCADFKRMYVYSRIHQSRHFLLVFLTTPSSNSLESVLESVSWDFSTSKTHIVSESELTQSDNAINGPKAVYYPHVLPDSFSR